MGLYYNLSHALMVSTLLLFVKYYFPLWMSAENWGTQFSHTVRQTRSRQSQIPTLIMKKKEKKAHHKGIYCKAYNCLIDDYSQGMQAV